MKCGKENDMKNYAVIVVYPYEPPRLVELDDYHLTLDFLYEHADCDTIQIVRCGNPYLPPDILLCIDDCGKLVNKPRCYEATMAYFNPYDFVVGQGVIGTAVGRSLLDEPDIYAFPIDEARKVLALVERF